MGNLQGFWSYVHRDDEAEGERITRLARDIAGQFEMLTGEPLSLFLDQDALKWGEEWRGKIDDTLSKVAFFIPVLTPRYLMSAECRRELQFFARQATRLGVKELVLPLLYVDVPSLKEGAGDDLAELLRTFQWEDWREVRFLDPASEGYRRGVAKIAARLVEANRQAEKIDVSTTPSAEKEAAAELEEAGFIDKLAAAEEALPQITNTTLKVGEIIESIGKTVQEAADDTLSADKRGSGFGARLFIIKELARRLEKPAEQLSQLTNEYASRFHEIDIGFRTVIEHAPEEIQRDPSSKPSACVFFNTVRGLSERANETCGKLRLMIDALTPAESMSRHLRPVFRRLRQGLTTMVEASEITSEWVQLIESTTISCDDQPTSATENVGS